jgi:protocatechuate 3,4-dioxygenase alpha subunit
VELKQTPSQTVGPFFHYSLMKAKNQNVLVDDQTQGQLIMIKGTVYDGDNRPVVDSILEIWQADAQGFFAHPEDPNHAKADRHFKGFGRADTVQDGTFSFKTVKPGRVFFNEAQDQAPHINIRIFARGMLIHAYTRLYFSDEAEVNAIDPVLNMVDVDRRHTLVAQRESGNDLPTYCFDIHLQGNSETVFFNP